jgi:hypothetical protein
LGRDSRVCNRDRFVFGFYLSGSQIGGAVSSQGDQLGGGEHKFAQTGAVTLMGETLGHFLNIRFNQLWAVRAFREFFDHFPVERWKV